MSQNSNTDVTLLHENGFRRFTIKNLTSMEDEEFSDPRLQIPPDRLQISLLIPFKFENLLFSYPLKSSKSLWFYNYKLYGLHIKNCKLVFLP